MRPSSASSANTPTTSASPSATATLAGFLIALRHQAPHDSSNFPWFRERYPQFFYIDRIVVASRRRGGGVGRAFYADVQSFAELRVPAAGLRGLPGARHTTRPCCSTAASASAKSAST